jgi:hypothetical protein
VCVQRLAQLTNLLGKAAVVGPKLGRLAPRGGHFLGEYRQNAAKLAQPIEHLISIRGLRGEPTRADLG